MKTLFYTLVTTLLLLWFNISSMGFEFTKDFEQWKFLFLYIVIIVITEKFRFRKKSKDFKYEQKEYKQVTRGRNTLNKKLVFMFIWACLCTSILISKILGQGSVSDTVFLALSVPMFFGVILPNLEKFKRVILNPALVLSFLPFIVVLFYIISRDGRNNVIGVLTSFIGVIILTIANENAKKEYRLAIVGVLGLIFFLLILLNGSRAGFISFFVGFIYIFRLTLKESSIVLKWSRVLIVHIFLSILVISFVVYHQEIIELFLNKWNGNSDISSGRKTIWINTIKQATLFGYGSDYFFRNYYIGDAHNIFIQVIGQYGVVTFLFFSLLVVYVIILLFKEKNTSYNAIFISYFILGLFENVLFIDFRFGTITFVVWYYIGLLLHDKNKSNRVGVLNENT